MHNIRYINNALFFDDISKLDTILTYTLVLEWVVYVN